ncbi:hypothetical protein [Loktanella sp. M215]|uniref:hypothetical protein n=1 Tax=Loktanella sp. M215 TaxID=2675431 RepID=UPI001F3AB556|nr:hypothetical protein [Loktanella sp. M215]MCF7701580.1 hypothetical protein [Loktanella sp. M215]
MYLRFFHSLRHHGVPVSIREFLAFLGGMRAGLALGLEYHRYAASVPRWIGLRRKRNRNDAQAGQS